MGRHSKRSLARRPFYAVGLSSLGPVFSRLVLQATVELTKYSIQMPDHAYFPRFFAETTEKLQSKDELIFLSI